MHTFEKTKLESFRENNMARILILLGLLTDIFSFFCSQNLKKMSEFHSHHRPPSDDLM